MSYKVFVILCIYMAHMILSLAHLYVSSNSIIPKIVFTRMLSYFVWFCDIRKIDIVLTYSA